MKILLLLTIIFLFKFSSFSQIGINSTGTPPDSSAMLDVNSLNKGVLFPKMTSSQRKNITSPATGLLVYDTDAGSLFIYNGQNWLNLLQGDGNKEVPLVQRFPSENQYSINAGTSVSIWGDYAVVGTSNDKILVYHRINNIWKEEATLRASDDTIEQEAFGTSVAIHGDYIVVGAKWKNTSRGGAYVYYRVGNTWSEQAKLSASDGANFDDYGTNVSICNDYLVVGAPRDDFGTQTDRGSAYIYVRSGSTWSEQAKVIANDGTTLNLFGSSVGIDGNYVVISALNNGTGSVYVFNRLSISWNQEAKLIADDGVVGDGFGLSVSISGNNVIVGAPYDDIGANQNQGSAYIFNRVNTYFYLWSQIVKVVKDKPVANELFGSHVSIFGDYAVVGVPRNTIGINTYQGCAYIFRRNYNASSFWDIYKKVIEPSGAEFNYFGTSVCINNSSFIIGSPSNLSISGTQHGAVSFGKIEY